MTSQPSLFPPNHADPVDTRTLVERMPGTADAPCHCGKDPCAWPFAESCWGLTETTTKEAA